VGRGSILSGLRTALAFLTRLPVGAQHGDEASLAQSVRWFPVVGALVGLVVGGVAALGHLIAPATVSAAVAVTVGVLLTGAFHEDGLADMADAVGAWNRDDALRLLRDPRHGTFGVVAIVASLLIRVAAVASLAAWAPVAVLPAAHALSRAATVWVLATVRPATPDGLGAGYARAVEPRAAASAVVVGLVVGAAGLGVWVAPAALLTALGATGITALAVRRFGGITGDVLGAVQQVTEIVVLVLASVVAAGGWWSPPWWG
jgi:adenosylcobinamide-GDP ribazoletransferase